MDVPLLTVCLKEFLPELQSLMNSFHLSYDAAKIKTSADEMELFSMVILKHKHSKMPVYIKGKFKIHVSFLNRFGESSKQSSENKKR